MKSKKIISISVIAVVVLSLIIGAIYFTTHYAKIDGKVYKNDIKDINIHLNGDDAEEDIRELNKCTEIEEMLLSKASENSIAKFKNFHNLRDLIIMLSEISSSDSEKLSHFDNLKDLCIYITTIDFKGFNNDKVSSIISISSKIANLEALSECQSLKSLTINHSTASDNCIIAEGDKYIMKDSSVFASFDYVEELRIFVDEIEDISGILEMDSLKVFEIDKGTLSEDNKKLLEDKGISVVENNQ